MFSAMFECSEICPYLVGWDISKEKLTIGPKIADKQFAGN